MNKSTQLIIKPYKDNYIAWLIDFYMLIIIPCVVDIFVDIFTDIEVCWKCYVFAFVIYSIVICLVAGIARFCYKSKLIVTEEEVIKIHRGKIQFQIKKEDIVSICIRKVNPLLKLLVVIGGFIGDIGTDLVFFRFYHAEVFEIRKFSGGIVQHSLTDKDDKNLQEFAESVTYRQAKKICEKLGLPFNVIKN